MPKKGKTIFEPFFSSFSLQQTRSWQTSQHSSCHLRRNILRKFLSSLLEEEVQAQNTCVSGLNGTDDGMKMVSINNIGPKRYCIYTYYALIKSSSILITCPHAIQLKKVCSSDNTITYNRSRNVLFNSHTYL